MAGEQGTGKHPHKSAEDPKEHHEGAKASTTHTTEHKAPAKTASHTEEYADGQGTGKHPHKKASDPREHHEGAKK